MSSTLRTPYVAIAIATLAPMLLAFATAPMSDRVFFSVATLATTALYVSYATPIALGAVSRLRGRWRHRGPWNLGGAGVAFACAAALWTFFVLFVSTLAAPLSAWMLGGLGVVFAAIYFTIVRKRFKGPAIDLASFERSQTTTPP